jgi:uncharacterized HhH-GPD family protein
MTITITGDADADRLLSEDPLALVVAMVLDQQIPLERAFRAPRDLAERLGGTLDCGVIGAMDPEALAAVFGAKPALHRFPSSMARRVQEVCRIVSTEYGGDAAAVWTSASDGKELLANVKALPGFGVQKARIFIALLGKQLGITTPGWQEASSPFGEPGTFLSVADIDSADSLARVRQYKQELKAAAATARR